MTDYALPITGTGSSQAVSSEAHDAEVQRAIDEAVAVETAARVAGLATKQPLSTVLTNTTAAFTTAQEAKLAGIAAGATANATDAQLRDRATHTGAQAIATVTGLQAALDGKASAAQGALADSAVQPGDDVSTLAETGAAKIMTAAERTKLAGVEAGAQVNTVTSVAGKTGAVALAKADVGLGSVDNTADADKPISAAQQSAFDAAALDRAVLRAVQQALAVAGVAPLGENNLGLVHGVTDKSGALLWGQRASGTTYEADTLREVVSDNNLALVWGITDAAGRVLIGITADGEIVGASAEVRTRIELLMTTGQSLAEGAAAAITTTAPYTGGEALRFANGPVGKQSETIGPALVALAEQTNESVATGCARRILADHPDRTMLMAGQAWGGKTIAEISIGAADGVYEKIQGQMDLAAAQSRGAVARAVIMINGEADGLLSSTTFDADLETYRRQFAADVAERLGQTEIPYLLTCQTSSVAGYKGGSIALRDSFTTPFLQLRAALSNPRVILVGPKYQYTYIDHSHIDALSTRLHGEKYGQVWRHAVLDGRQWLPVHATSVLRVGSNIALTLQSPVGAPIEIDTGAVTDPGNFGFNLLDAGGVTISSVTQTGDFEITIACSGAVPNGARLSYAFHNGTAGTSGWNAGARGCIRDSDPTRSIYTGAAMPNWLCAFETVF